jgi:excinuclease ABC subunit B
MTGSMERAIAETGRRRDKQVEFNAEHGITPVGIQKAVADIMEGARAAVHHRGKGRRAAEAPADYRGLSPEMLAAKLKKLEQAMHAHARELEFEDAARVRDEIARLRNEGLGLPPTRAAGNIRSPNTGA